MDRILALSLVGAYPGNVFGPSMSSGALESFAKAEGNSNSNSRGGAAAPAGGTRSASAGSGANKCAAERTGEKEANVTRSSCHALDLDRQHWFCCFDAVVPPY